ncbi:DUF2303 family protein [Bradyrhizobium sp. Pha-3]|uniref:DUF2303 family protein n=1 Tax=Bradyrhizobium sp. Pha-3 TaxID=208375 RepID=UPI0035D453B7
MSEADSVAKLAAKAAGVPQIMTMADGRELLVLPQGFEFKDVSPANKAEVLAPKQLVQSVTLQNADALIEYLNRFKADTSLMFADVQANRIVCALDYHDKAKASLVTHRAMLDLPFSEEWKTWSGISGQLKPQLEFARFIEENAPDIKAPDAASLLEAVRDLQARRTVNFIKAVRTSSDNESFEFNDNTEARTKGDLELPTRFLLSIPVYFGDAPVEVGAFLRWKLDEGSLNLGIKLHRAEHMRQAALRLIVTDAVEKTGVMAVFGKLG